ncbi:hypothetical protein FRC00_000578 [Tulasnella sp. 408]|nr:hypothetical protein FRC00_000578 [Tulasnella sp. 408]
MSAKTATASTINSVSQSLLKSIESENALPLGLLRSLQAFSESDQAFSQDEIRASICETIDRLKQRLLENVVTTQRRRNDLLPIQRLPPEVLSTIISHALAEVESYNHQQRLIQLSTVSSWWRSVALETPSLWSVIDSNDADWVVSLALERSKDAPLTVVSQEGCHTTTLSGRCACRHPTLGPDDFFELVSPHTTRWGSVSLRQLGYGLRSIEWLGQNKIQLSRRLQQLTLCWTQSPSTETPVTGFSGPAEGLQELTLRNLHVSRADIIHILSSSHRMTSLNLESLLVSEREDEAVPHNDLSDTHPTVDLPCLTKLSLKWLPPSVLLPIVQGINISTLEILSIAHANADDDPAKTPFPIVSIIAKLIADTRWVTVDLRSTNVILQPHLETTRQYSVELRGEYSVILPWLRLHLMPQITEEYSTELKMSSEGLGDNPSQGVLDNLMRFPEVRSVVLEGSTESWRWMWLLSLPGAVQTGSGVAGQNPVTSWLWPGLRHLMTQGDCVSEFTLLSVLLARYGPPSKGRSMTTVEALPCRLEKLGVRPGNNVWREEVLDRIRELVGPGRFHWVTD